MQRTNAVRKPVGGFVFITVRQICRVWIALRQRRIRIVDVWVWLAAHELVARRCQVQPGHKAQYRTDEFARLVGSSHSIPHSLRRLAQVGLLCWDETQITFPEEATSMDENTALNAMLEKIPNNRRRVPVPRRIIRYLAGGCPRVLIATMLGYLLRCLYYRAGHCCPDGHCKATWIAEVFGLSLRQVKHARHQLETLGLLERHDTPQWVLNSYGLDMTINLQWDGPSHDDQHVQTPAITPCVPTPPPLAIDQEGNDEPSVSLAVADTDSTLSQAVPIDVPVPVAPEEIAPPSSPKSEEIAPPDSDGELSTREENQKPACGGTPGAFSALFTKMRSDVRAGRISPAEPDPVVLRSSTAQRPQAQRVPASQPAAPTPPAQTEEPSAASLLPVPMLRHILVQDLRDTERLLQLYDQAVTAGLISRSEADRLNFVALAQHVLSYRPDSAGGLFTQLLRKHHFDYITQDDEDTAQQRLKRALYGGVLPVLHDAADTEQRRAG